MLQWIERDWAESDWAESDRFERTQCVVPPGWAGEIDAARVAGMLVEVRVGVVELITSSGVRRQLGAGAMFWLAGLAVPWLRNPGPGLLELVTVRPRRALADPLSVPASSVNEHRGRFSDD